MITKFKIFENLDKEPEVGDYILLKDNDWFFLEGHHSANIIGVITQLIPFNTIQLG